MKISVRLVIKAQLGRGIQCSIEDETRQVTSKIPPSSKKLCFCHLAFLILELIDDNI